MSILSPLFTQAHLASLLAQDAAQDLYPHLLRWLVWFPLLSTEELTRLERARMAKLGQTRSHSRVAAQLQKLKALQLVAHVVINEPGWPPHQHRYHLTDAGLYVFASLFDPPLSVAKLVQAYAVERADLIARLVRFDIHLTLAEFSTKLFAEGSAQGYPLVSYQQPWAQTDTVFGHRQTLRCDAAFLLSGSQGTEHAFYVYVDTDERNPFDRKRERILLLRLLNLRHALHLQREAMPQLLIITRASRLADWGELLDRCCEQRGTALPDGAITTLDHLQRSGAHGPIWWTFTTLIQSINNGSLVNLTDPSVRLSDLMGTEVSQTLAERFSQRQTFAHLLTERKSGPLRQTAKRLPSYVGKSLMDEAATLCSTSLADALSGTKTEQQEATALLNLTLSATQKDLLFWLTHHPLLTVHHLATLHHLEAQDVRGVQKQMVGLSALNLLIPFMWNGPRPWRECERYVLAEPALRYCALREGRQNTYYLLPEEYKKKNGVPALSIQRGTAGLFAQMKHTHGLYECMAHLVTQTHCEGGQILVWKNAQESIRWYRDPLTHAFMQIRPDAEIIYQVEGHLIPQSILVEYDRATSTRREYEAKFQGYADYQDTTRLTLPTILMITQDEQTAQLIRTCTEAVGANLSIVLVLEEQIRHHGLRTLPSSNVRPL